MGVLCNKTSAKKNEQIWLHSKGLVKGKFQKNAELMAPNDVAFRCPII